MWKYRLNSRGALELFKVQRVRQASDILGPACENITENPHNVPACYVCVCGLWEVFMSVE
jgi:hypothetical protein